MGILNLKIPTQTANITYSTSRNASKHLINSILKKIDFSIYDHDSQVLVTKNEFHLQQLEADSNNVSALFNQQDLFKQRSLLRAQNSLSAWLNTVPVHKDHFDLSAIEFCDALCLRYMKPLQNLHLFCNGVGNCSLLLTLWIVKKVAWCSRDTTKFVIPFMILHLCRHRYMTYFAVK